MSKFKKGDKVRSVVNDSSMLTIGNVYTVTGVDEDYVWVESDEGEIDYFYPKKFELFEEGSEDKPVSKDNVNGIPSDGGSSDYYFTKLPRHLIDQIVETGGIEIKDIIRYVFDNNADAFNIVKAQKRIVEASKGKGKSGITALYDANKIKFFANEQYEAIKQGEVE